MSLFMFIVISCTIKTDVVIVDVNINTINDTACKLKVIRSKTLKVLPEWNLSL